MRLCVKRLRKYLVLNQMQWSKRGLVFKAEGNFGWMNSHAQVPTALDLGNTLRIFFSTRAAAGESKIAYLDVDAKDPKKILYIHPYPILTNGEPGTFDEHGTMPSYVFQHSSGKVFMYYSGWSRRASVPYSNLAGLALSADASNFERVGQGPVLSTNIHEPYSATSPFMICKGNIYYSFYCSGVAWHKIADKYEHTYDIKVATSKDGIDWRQNGKVCISPRDPFEAITRPSILKRADGYHMWFCTRGSQDFRDGIDSYNIGYAFSDDLKIWIRQDENAGITKSSQGWDSTMIAYPFVLKTNYATYMFYNGNGFGQSGFGYAVLEE
jgi:predicted GH43/DUF377 family glycosyl hydrolase